MPPLLGTLNPASANDRHRHGQINVCAVSVKKAKLPTVHTVV